MGNPPTGILPLVRARARACVCVCVCLLVVVVALASMRVTFQPMSLRQLASDSLLLSSLLSVRWTYQAALTWPPHSMSPKRTENLLFRQSLT